MKITDKEWEQLKSAKDYVQRCLDRINAEEVEDHADLLGAVEVMCAAVSECQFVAEELTYAAEPVDTTEIEENPEGF